LSTNARLMNRFDPLARQSPFRTASSFLQAWEATLTTYGPGEAPMRTNLTIFILFFGIALLDAIRGGHWLRILFWLGIGAFFFWADRRQLARRAP